MQETSYPMKKTSKIIRASIHTFLTQYQHFTATPALLALPFSLSLLLSQAIVPTTPLLVTIHHRLQSLFFAAGFPYASEFFYLLSLKLSQTIANSILTIPFTFTSLLIAKSLVIQSLNLQKHNPKTPFSSFFSLYYIQILSTQIFNSFFLLAANATAYFLLIIAFNCVESLGFSSPTSLLFLSATGAVLYSIILANALVICNLALILSGVENHGGYLATLKACVLIKGRTSTALSLALPLNLLLISIESLFQYRIIRAYDHGEKPISSLALETLFIAYLYSIIIVLDTIVSYNFYKSCDTSRYLYRIEIAEEERIAFMNLKVSDQIQVQNVKLPKELP